MIEGKVPQCVVKKPDWGWIKAAWSTESLWRRDYTVTLVCI